MSSGSGTVRITGGQLDRIGIINQINKLQAIGNTPSGIEPIKFCNWAAPEWGDGGNTAESAWYSAALIAVATINTVAQWSIAQKRYQIAKDYAKIAEDKWNRFKNGYMPLERAMLNEISTTPVYQADYNGARSLYGEWFRQAYAESQNRLASVADKYELCVDPSLVRDLNNAGTTAAEDGINFGYRFEENRAILKDDERWNRRSNLLNLGRDIHAQSAQYAKYANDILAGLSDLAGQGAAGAMQMLGYMKERQDTYYPQQFSGVSGLVGEAGYGGLFSSLYSGAQIGASWS